MHRPVQSHSPNWPNYVHPGRRKPQGSFWTLLGGLALAWLAVYAPLLLIKLLGGS